MPRRQYDWEGLKAEFIARRIEEPGYSLTDFSKERGVPKRTLHRHAGTWIQDADQTTTEVAEEALGEVLLDHIQIRKALLEDAREVRDIFKWELALYRKRRLERLEAAEKGEAITELKVSELQALERMSKELHVEGGGLPKEHVIRHDDFPDEVILNRKKQRAVADKARSLVKYGLKHGHLKVVGGTDVEDPE